MRNSEGEIISGLTASNAERLCFIISPNPGKDQIKLEYNLEGYKSGTNTLFNHSDQIAEEVKIGPAFQFINLNISNLNPRSYIARILSENGFQLSEKFVKVD